MRSDLKHIAALATVAALTAGGVSIASSTATQVSIEPSVTLMPGDTAPFDAAGVKAIRRGKAIPSGYRLVGQKVTNTRGTPAAGAALHFQCPGHKRLKTFGETGAIGFAIDRRYVNHRQTWVRTYAAKRGNTDSGIVYAVCR